MNPKRLLLVILLIGNLIIIKAQGIKQPEYSSFEPVDAPDMVNLISGDMTYVLPLLSVPSPEGGYSIALSYHAGIPVDMESSWVGLGWNINPGTIDRGVDGFPDDWKNEQTSVISYFEGETEVEHRVSVDCFFKGVGSVGISVNWTNKSFGGSVSYGYSNNDGSFSISAGTNGVRASLGFSDFNMNVSPSGGSIGASFKGRYGIGSSSVGISFSSKSQNGYFSSPFGATSISGRSSDSKLSFQKHGFMVTVPIPWIRSTVTYEQSWYSYYAYQKTDKQIWGTLYAENGRAFDPTYPTQIKNGNTMDCYSNGIMLNSSQPNLQFASNGSSFPQYDRYEVNAQGLNGQMTPRLYDFGTLFGGSEDFSSGIAERSCGIVAGGAKVALSYDSYKFYDKTSFENDPDKSGYQKVAFNFEGQNASYIERSEALCTSITGSDLDDFTYSGANLLTSYDGKTSYNSGKKRHSTGRYVEWFTNDEIRSNKATGFYEEAGIHNLRCNSSAKGYSDLFAADGIGGFKITTADGKTYYYSIPVYQFEIINEIYNPLKPTQEYKYEFRRGKYAYAWLLTAITGPDYVDINDNGPDDSDYGYWVNFKYGKWTDGYIWRSPAEGVNKSSDGKFVSIAYGRKQIYYLNEIETRTHSAYFVKDIKDDGLVNVNLDKEYNRGNERYFVGAGDDIYKNCRYINYIFYSAKSTIKYTSLPALPHKKLKLNRIILVDKKSGLQLGNITAEGKVPIASQETGCSVHVHNCLPYGKYYDVVGKEYNMDGSCMAWNLKNKFDNPLDQGFTMYYPDNVLDVNDISTADESDLNIKSLQTIDFNYDYSLCVDPLKNTGKLALKSLYINGKGGAKVLPPYVFSYDYNPPYNVEAKDSWGFYDPDAINHTMDYNSDLHKKVNSAAWSLTAIKNPLGAILGISYESDSYSKEAVFDGVRNKYTLKNPVLVSGGPLIDYLRSGFLFDADIDFPQTYLKEHQAYLLKGKLLTQKFPDNDECEIQLNTYVYSEGIVDNKARFRIMLDPTDVELFRGSDLFILKSIKDLEMIFYINSNWPNQTNCAYGGGIRVSSVSLATEETSYVKKTKYNYFVPNTENTSGITCYSPVQLEKTFIPYSHEIPGPGVFYSYVTVENYGNDDTKVESKLIYHFKTIECANLAASDNAFKMGDQFEVTWNDDPINSNAQIDQGEFSRGCWPNRETYHAYRYINANALSTTVHNKFSSLGHLLEKRVYNHLNQPISSTNYNYTAPSDGPGTSKETFNTICKRIKFNRYNFIDNQHCFVFSYPTISSRQIYPSFLTSIVETANGSSTTTNYSDFDFFTGEPQTTVVTKPNNEKYKTTNIPAYTITDYLTMGPKALDENNKNMLAQSAGNYLYKLNADGSVAGVLNASIQTWNDNWKYRFFDGTKYADPIDPDVKKVWRKEKSFEWRGDVNTDGTYKNFSSYDDPSKIKSSWSNFFGEDGIDGWVKTSQVLRYNHYSNPLEVIDVSSKFAATRMGDNNSKIIATAGNTSYNSFSYTGFEYTESKGDWVDYGGEFMGHALTNIQVKSDGAVIMAHTGDYYLKMTGTESPVYTASTTDGLLAGRKYKASVWMHNSSAATASLVVVLTRQDGSTNTQSKSINATDSKSFDDWTQVNVLMDEAVPSGGSLKVSVQNTTGIVYLDDIRIQPVDASVTACTYDDAGNVSAILNNDNFAVKYDYDAVGRLIATYKEMRGGFKKVSENKYKYARINHVVDFSSDPNVLVDKGTGVSATLTALGDLPGSSYKWQFSDGSVLTGNPVTQILSSGVIKLTATDGDGNTESCTKTLNYYLFQITYPSMHYPIILRSSQEYCTITWTAPGLPGEYQIDLLSNGSYSNTIGTTSDSSFKWLVNCTPGDNYQIRVTHKATGISTVNGSFSIVKQY
jgi:YD repeat-containing protein